MADGEEGDHFGAVETTTTTTANSSFSQLLFSDDDNDIVGLNAMGPTHSFDHHYSSTATTNLKLPKMLCFGGYYDIQHHHHHENREVVDDDDNDNNVVLVTPQKSVVTCSDSSSASSAINSRKNDNYVSVNVNAAASKSIVSNRKRNGSGQGTAECCGNTIVKTPRTSKKTKTENPISTGQPKARKEKLGERITALQQLVSPFGKTDTASVLHEAMGYIRFLQDQVQVLCSPYLKHQPVVEENGEEPRKDLKSRGLCLVPVECTVYVASSNGADYWSPAMVKKFSSSIDQPIHLPSIDSETPNTF